MSFSSDLKDWHRADVIAELKKRKTNLSKVSRQAGYKSTTLANALERHWPRGEKIIAEAIGVPPETIWPSRYQEVKG